MAANNIFKTLVVGLVLVLPFAKARAIDDDNDDDNEHDGNEQYEMDAQDANSRQQKIVDGPQLPNQFLQKPTTPPMGITAASTLAPMNAAAAAAPEPQKADVKVHAQQAKEAAKVAKQAAKVATNVAKHSVKVTHHAKKALKHALGALHDARVDSSGLDKRQKDTLKKAEAHLREATQTADHGELKKRKDTQDLKKQKMEEDLKRKGGISEREQMHHEIKELREKLKEKKVDDKDIDKALDELEDDLEKTNGPINDESKAELERLRRLVESLEDPEEDHHEESHEESHGESHAESDEVATPVQQQGLDIDTEMPYGDLEPFGREDTAQELTEASIRESDGMVDQLERAEVAEEKRSVFRALTRLRGAAITSFDGVARSQTGNIDGYNKIHQWRNTHPLHHLADEESDVSKWAFPDNAD